jgi:hypothetical protein
MDRDKQPTTLWRTGPLNARKGTLAYHDTPPCDEISTITQASLGRDWCYPAIVTSRCPLSDWVKVLALVQPSIVKIMPPIVQIKFRSIMLVWRVRKYFSVVNGWVYDGRGVPLQGTTRALTFSLCGAGNTETVRRGRDWTLSWHFV